MIALADENLKTFRGGKPGVYRSIPFADYLALDAVSKSRLDPLCDGTPAHCYDAMIAPREETEALLIGRAYHTLTLEGVESFKKDYATSEQCNAILKTGDNKGKRCLCSGIVVNGGKWFCGKHGSEDAHDESRQVLTLEQTDQIVSMRNGTKREAKVRALLESEGENELSVVWQDKETSLPCKCRMDLVRPKWNAIADLKTTESADRESFIRAIKKYGYHRQDAWYLRAAIFAGIDVEYFAIIPQEKKRPYCANSFKFEHDTTRAGEIEVVRALRIYAKCKESGVWPGYAGNFEPIGLNAWDLDRINSGN